MGFFDKFNKGQVIFDVDTEGWEFVKLADLYENNGSDGVYQAVTFFITTGNYGKQAVVGINEEVLVNLPAHLVEMVEALRADEEAVERVNKGECFFKIYTYFDEKHKKDCYSITFVDPEKMDKKSKK